MSRLYQQRQRSNLQPFLPIERQDGMSRCAFTLVELLVVIAVIGILASLLLPALQRTKARAQGAFCLNNTRQLVLAWKAYSDDHEDRLAYNLGMSGKGSSQPVASKTNLNWVNNVMDWELNPDNIDLAGITEAGLGSYTKNPGIYHCPSDNVLSEIQRKAGWNARVRSYSMNAMVGDAGDISASGKNANNTNYVQFFTMTAIPHPADIFVFLDEHPDSINDGYFLNRSLEITYSANGYNGSPSSGGHATWIDLPASYHNGAASFAFADGHSEAHRWKSGSTMPPALPDAAQLPLYLHSDDRTDFDWVLEHMSVDVDDYHYQK